MSYLMKAFTIESNHSECVHFESIFLDLFICLFTDSTQRPLIPVTKVETQQSSSLMQYKPHPTQIGCHDEECRQTGDVSVYQTTESVTEILLRCDLQVRKRYGSIK